VLPWSIFSTQPHAGVFFSLLLTMASTSQPEKHPPPNNTHDDDFMMVEDEDLLIVDRQQKQQPPAAAAIVPAEPLRFEDPLVVERVYTYHHSSTNGELMSFTINPFCCEEVWESLKYSVRGRGTLVARAPLVSPFHPTSMIVPMMTVSCGGLGGKKESKRSRAGVVSAAHIRHARTIVCTFTAP
jgi:hypothetical protein